MTYYIGHNCKVLVGAGSAGETCVGGDEGLPCAGHSHFQPALQWTTLTHLHTKTEPMRAAYGASANTYLKKAVNTKQEEMPEKEGCQSRHRTRRGARAGARETPEEGRCWRKRRDKRSLIQSKVGAEQEGRLKQRWQVARASTLQRGLWPVGELHQSIWVRNKEQWKKRKNYALTTFPWDAHCLIKGTKHDVQWWDWGWGRRGFTEGSGIFPVCLLCFSILE